VIVVVGGLVPAGSADPELILALVSCGGHDRRSFFFPLLLGLTWRRTSPAAALASSVGGFLTTATWTSLTLAKVGWAGALHPIVPGLAVALLLILGLTPFTRPAPAEALARFFPPAGAAAQPAHAARPARE
jgi:Na+/proline symporter